MAALLLGIPYYTTRSNSLSSVKFLTNYYFSGMVRGDYRVGRVSNARAMRRRFSFSLSRERRICWSSWVVISAPPQGWPGFRPSVSVSWRGQGRGDDTGIWNSWVSICSHTQIGRCRRFQWLYAKHGLLRECSGLQGSVSLLHLLEPVVFATLFTLSI